MKKTVLKPMMTTALLFFGLALPATLAAQPYPITNNLPCDVEVRLAYYGPNPQFPIGGGPTCTPCGWPTTMVIPPATTLMFPPPTCGPVCDIWIEVIAIGGAPISPVTDAETSPGPTRGSTSSLCAPSVLVHATTTGGTINP